MKAKDLIKFIEGNPDFNVKVWNQWPVFDRDGRYIGRNDGEPIYLKNVDIDHINKTAWVVAEKEIK